MEKIITRHQKKVMAFDAMIFEEYAAALAAGSQVSAVKEAMRNKYDCSQTRIDLCVKREAARRGLVEFRKPAWKIPMLPINKILKEGK